MATVYLAHDLKHDRSVALKVLHPELAATIGLERFQREIRVAAQLQHPQILPVYDSGSSAGLLWFTMPYVEGANLRERLESDRRLPIPEAVRILEHVARALAYAHRRGVIHRDLKPENVLLSEDNVFLADFGIAKPVDTPASHNLTKAGVVVGTPTYMAPEQAVADPAMDHRVDIYAFGILAYELITGQPPFTNLSPGQLLVAHAMREPEPVTRQRPGVPAPLAALIARCLRKDPVERWHSADALYEGLRATHVPERPAPVTPAASASTAESPRTERLGTDAELGRAASAVGAWREAYDRLGAADAANALEPEDLERLGEAAWWVADGQACLRARERAYRCYADRGEHRAAARIAIALAEDHLHRIARSVSQGWLRRAERHLDGLPEVVEQGWLHRLRTVIALETDHDLDAAMGHAELSLRIARAVGDMDLEALALQDRGRILVALGRVDEGMALIDEAMAAASAGALTPRTTGRTYCNMMSTCQRLADFGRAAEWHKATEHWCEPYADSGFPGICRVHRAGMLRLRGALPEAEREARRAADELGDFLTDVSGEAYYELGEIRLRMGDLEAADAMFREAHARGRNPQPGLAMLRFAQGRSGTAQSMLERALTALDLPVLDRARLLPALVEIAASCGAHDVAAAAAVELETIIVTYRSPALVAAAATARGTVELVRGQPAQAMVHLQRARRIWTELELPVELARTRMALSRTYSLLGDTDEAALEERAALAELSRIGARA